MDNGFLLLNNLHHTFQVVFVHYYIQYSSIRIIGTSSWFYCEIIQVIKHLLFVMRMLGFFCIQVQRIGFICSSGIVLFTTFCIVYFSITNYLMRSFSAVIWWSISICDYRWLYRKPMGICCGASTTTWVRIAYHSYCAG